MHVFLRAARVATVSMMFGGVVAGCSDTDPAGPATDAPGDDEPLGAASVTGEFSTQSGSGRRIVTIAATQDANGVVTGGYRISFTATGAFFEVAVTCLAKRENIAWIGGRVTASTGSEIVVGASSYFFAIDNSPADEAPSSDIVSVARVNDTRGAEQAFCRERPLDLPVLTNLLGDVRVD